MNKRWLAWMLLVIMVTALSACVASPRTAPPPPRQEMRMASPGPGYFWVSGHWEWRSRDWYWIRGHWERKRPGRVWVSGHWERRGKRQVWVRGHWRRARAYRR
ncbi:MAG: YXWGXW repeat-containing protein [Candidatus Aminicenantes bacterium]|nr:YXWGXW repeat-containing protein [Candidatus Aminicenantes bacterium]